MEKTVLITGCSSGIGRTTAEAFLDAEWTVYATARDESDVSDLEMAGCETAALDVTDDEQVESVVEGIIEDTGRIDCLVNNAGYAQLGPIEDVPTEQIHEQFAVNVYGPHRLMRTVLPHMRDRGDGTIVNVSSAGGRITIPGMGVYGGSKFAIEAMSDALRGEVADYGIDTVVIEPGPVSTNFADRAEEETDGLEHSGAYERFYELYEDAGLVSAEGVGAISPEEVAEAILDAAVAPDPPARYPVGALAHAAEYARFLPDSIRDRALEFAYRVL